MTNFGSKIFNSAVSSLNAQQGVLAGLSNNIANVNTPGYARRGVLLENQTAGGTGGLSIGSGVKISGVIRYVDEFANSSLRGAIQGKFAASAKDDLLARIEDVFNITGSAQSIGSTLTGFFSAINDLSVNPTSIELRSNVIERAQDLVTSIKKTYGTIADLQREIDARVTSEVDAVNALTAQIAELNQQVVQVENNGGLAADERDRRDALMEKLAEKISFNSIELADGSVKISVTGGLDLVFGSKSRSLDVTTSPTFGGSPMPPTLWGGVPSYVVYNYGSDASPAHIDLTASFAAGEGTLGGLLHTRGTYDVTDTSPFEGDGILPQLGARIEAITRFLLSDFNETYLGADEDSGTAGHQASSADLDGLPPDVYGFFDFLHSGAKDVDGDGLPNDIGNHAGITNYSSLLQLTNTDPRGIAASLDLDPTTQGSTSFAAGDGSNLSNIAALQNTTSTFTVDSYSFTGTVEQVYVNAVSYIGNEKAKAATERSVSESNFKLAADRRDQLSGVSLDEEFAQLVRFQKAFEASARMIRVGNDLLTQIVNLL